MVALQPRTQLEGVLHFTLNIMKTRSTALSRSLELLVTVAAPLAGIAGIAAQKEIPVGNTPTVLAAIAAGLIVPVLVRFVI